ATLQIDGSQCQERLRQLSETGRDRYWLDPDRGHLVRRHLTEHQGQVIHQIDAEYRRHDVCGWALNSWVRKDYGKDGTLLVTTRFEVLKSQFNAPQKAEQFSMRFPVGAYVYDQRNEWRYRINPDGTMRPLTPEGQELSGSVPQP